MLAHGKSGQLSLAAPSCLALSQRLFGAEGLPWQDRLLVLVAALTVFLLVGVEKLVRIRFRPPAANQAVV